MKQAKVIKSTSSGSVCLNDTVIQIAAWNLPFGGVGDSGIGSYHGKATFETFSHRKSIVKRFFFLEHLFTTQRYPPYGNKIQLIKQIILR
uniref:Aldehyde dehydrogenase n=1 Tax=Prochloron didemni P2-Fiji TaxID=910454 RepID=G0XS46_PRODI|nr:aldehyde dehydrogenase [Prochloron didemni P2-Fiji]